MYNSGDSSARGLSDSLEGLVYEMRGEADGEATSVLLDGEEDIENMLSDSRGGFVCER
jgi:hypothetical protein